jgi:hypothetical protein
VCGLEVCNSPGLVLGPQFDQTRGPALDLVAQIMFGFGPGANDSNQMLYRKFRALVDQPFIAKKSYS